MYFLQFEVAQQHPYINAVLWGPGFESYDSKSSVATNIRSQYWSDDYFDIIYLGRPFYKNDPINNVSFGEPIPETITFTGLHESFTCVRTSDTHQSGRAPPFCSPLAHGDSIAMADVKYVDLAFFAYAREMRFFSDAAQSRLFVSHKQDASELLFKPGGQRDIDVLLVGSENYINYPLRNRIFKLHEKGLIKGAMRYIPAVLRRNLNQTGPQLPTWETSQTREQNEAQVRTYAAMLARSKIVIVTVSINNYALKKYFEAAMSGALLIGDVPCESSEEFRSYMIEISRSDSDAFILQTIEWWRTHDTEREGRAKLGQQLVHSKYRTTLFLDRMLHKAEEFLNGSRGIHYSHDVDCIYGNQPKGDGYQVMIEYHVKREESFQALAAVVNDAPLYPDPSRMR